MASAALGRTLFWAGDAAAATTALDDAVQHRQPPRNNLSVIGALGYLAEIAVQRNDFEAAEQFADRAIEMSRAQGLSEHWVTAIGLVARGKVLAHSGRLDEAAQPLERAVVLVRRGAGAVERAHSLLALARLRALQGEPAGARALLAEAREAADQCPDPGVLKTMLADAGRAARSPRTLPEALTERELAVLRLMSTQLSLREIGDALFVSYNTVKSHVRGIYRKVDASTRAEAVARARDLGLL
jgi:LuxR family maltose regulon positive regulatory protein